MIVSSTVRWGGIAGVVAAALLVLSAILNQLSPIKTTYDSAADYLYLVAVFAAYVAVLVALLGIHAVHRGMPRYGRLGAIGTVMSFAGYAIIATVTAINMNITPIESWKARRTSSGGTARDHTMVCFE